MSTFWLVLLLLILLVLLYAGGKLRKKEKSYAIPKGKEVYEDLETKGKILRSYRYGLSGKPDMIKRKGNMLIPYEYKTTDANIPRDGHIYQMVAYFIILADLYPHLEIPYGVLKYKNQAFRVDNIPENRNRLLRIMDEMRSTRMEPERNHSNSGRCFKCSYNEICQQKLISSKQ